MRCFVRPQYFFWMRIKGNHHRCSIYRLSVFRRRRNDCLMPEMDAVEDTDGEKERTWQLRELRNRTEDLHHNSLRSAHPGNFRQTQHPLENVLTRRVLDLVDSDRVDYVEAAGFRPAKRFQVRAATERFADIVRIRADIKAFAAQHAEIDFR